METSSRLAVVIVSYSVCDLLRDCLASIQASTALTADRLTVDTIVIDNASADDSAAMVANEFPDATLVALEENLGFTGGNNLALSILGFDIATPHPVTLSSGHHVTPDYVLLLNPDAAVVDDALWQMVDFLERTSAAGVCGAHLTYGDGAFQHGAFQFPSLAQVLIDLFPLPQVRGMHRLHDSSINGRYPNSLWNGSQPFAVDFVLGAAMMVRADAIRAVGGLDDGYFMYCEEMDWCLRLADAGWPVYALPTPRVIHHAGQSSQQVRWSAFERLWHSRFRFFEKHSNRYSPSDVGILRAAVQVSMRVRAMAARRRFAAGEVNGVELHEELSAYANVGQIAAGKDGGAHA